MRVIAASMLLFFAADMASATTTEPWLIHAGYQLVDLTRGFGPIFAIEEALAPLEPPSPLIEPSGPLAAPWEPAGLWEPIVPAATWPDVLSFPTPSVPGHFGPTTLAPIAPASLDAPAAVPVPAAGPLLAAALLAGWLGARRRRA